MKVSYPRDFFADLDGKPLDSGSLYIGEENKDPEVFPVACFWDSALTIAAAQPVSISSGYVVHNGARADLYTAPTYSFRARNRLGAQVDYSASTRGYDSGLRSDLAASTGSSLVGFIQSGTGAVSRTVQSKLRETISVKDFGAVGDGVTNDRAAIAAAVVAARGKRLVFPEGNYLINTDGGSITLEEVELAGENVLDGATGTIDQGANLWITGTTNSPFKLRRGSSVRGFGWYYPGQADNAVPTVYPDTLSFDFTNGAVQFVNIYRNVVYNAYRFVDIDNGATGAVGHVEIMGNYICALNRGVYVRHNAEHIRVERNNFTFGHWLAATEAGSRAYMRANATAFQVDQTDGVEFNDNLIFGHLNGYLAAAQGNCQLNHLSLNKFDQVRYPIKATGSGNFSAAITANTFNAFNGQNTALQGRSIEVSTTGAARESIAIDGNNFMAATEDHIYTTGNAATRNIVIGINNFLSWAAYKSSGTYGALNINGTLTNLNIVGGWLMGGNSTTYSYGIMGSFNTLTCNGVTFDGCQRPLSVTVNYLTGSGNVSFATGHTASDVYTATTKAWGPNNFDKPQDKTTLTTTLALLPNYANDAAAAAGGVPVGGWYRNATAVQIRTV